MFRGHLTQLNSCLLGYLCWSNLRQKCSSGEALKFLAVLGRWDRDETPKLSKPLSNVEFSLNSWLVWLVVKVGCHLGNYQAIVFGHVFGGVSCCT